MQATLEDFGIYSLLTDYVAETGRPAISAMGAALPLAADTLERRPGELQGQLLARLSPLDAGGLDITLSKARSPLATPALVPFRPSFRQPVARTRRFDPRERPPVSCCSTAGRSSQSPTKKFYYYGILKAAWISVASKAMRAR